MINQNNFNDLVIEAKDIRKQIISMIVAANASHIGSSYSVVEILVYLYEKVLKINPRKPTDPERDRFILSKGWGISALYSLLYRKGFIKKKLIDQYCKDGSKMIGVATRNGIPGIEATTGSMGHGLPIGAGIAKTLKLQKRRSRVFVIISDGELDEGSTWEGILIAAHHRLDNLTVIVDYNKWQSFGRTNQVLNLEPLVKKFLAFNWDAEEINGHNFNEIHKAVKRSLNIKGKPHVIIANTIKGKGLSVIEDKNDYHYRTPREEELKVAHDEGLI